VEDDLIISQDVDRSDSYDLIESQLMIIGSIAELENDLYDDCLTDKIKIIARALRIIYKVQSNILKEI
jgi:hypothetical protein